jgi:RNA polymerase sigma-70 factor (ECF subfamily)
MIIPHFFKSLSAFTDEELMQRVGSKDDDRAYDELYHRHARRLMGFFFRQTGGNEALAADLTQDTFMRVWMARDRFSGTSFHTWLLTIGYNLLKNHYRHSEHEKDYESFAMQTQEEVGDNGVIDQLDQQTFDQILSRLLEKMPPESRLLFSLRFEEELTVPQIAVVMAIPEGTVKSRLHILTQTLKLKLRLS